MYMISLFTSRMQEELKMGCMCVSGFLLILLNLRCNKHSHTLAITKYCDILCRLQK